MARCGRRRCGRWSGSAIRSAVPGLIEALIDSTVREDVARVLKKIGDARAVEALIDGLLGTNWMVRRHAAEALGKIGDRRGVDPLIESLQG